MSHRKRDASSLSLSVTSLCTTKCCSLQEQQRTRFEVSTITYSTTSPLPTPTAMLGQIRLGEACRGGIRGCGPCGGRARHAGGYKASWGRADLPWQTWHQDGALRARHDAGRHSTRWLSDAPADEAADLPRLHGRQGMGATLRRGRQQHGRHGKHRHAVPLPDGAHRVPRGLESRTSRPQEDLLLTRLGIALDRCARPSSSPHCCPCSASSEAEARLRRVALVSSGAAVRVEARCTALRWCTARPLSPSPSATSASATRTPPRARTLDYDPVAPSRQVCYSHVLSCP